jgi:hypothetical protein
VEHFYEHIWLNNQAAISSSSSNRLLRDPAQQMIGKTVIFLKHLDHDIPALAERFKARIGTIKHTAPEGAFYVSFEQTVASLVLLKAHHLLLVE